MCSFMSSVFFFAKKSLATHVTCVSRPGCCCPLMTLSLPLYLPGVIENKIYNHPSLKKKIYLFLHNRTGSSYIILKPLILCPILLSSTTTLLAYPLTRKRVSAVFIHFSYLPISKWRKGGR